MTRIDKAFQSGKALIVFITGGDPDIATTRELILRLAEVGVDMIEIGVPFSDPVAEGPVIQEASARALAGGTSVDTLFDMASSLRAQVTIPLVFMTYANPIIAYGKDRFFARCEGCGIDGVIVADLPFEESAELADVCQQYAIPQISMVAPTSLDRVEMISASAQGFIYCVSSLGVTGVRAEITTDLEEMIARVRGATKVPCAIGFGVSTPAQAQRMAAIADGVIIGSAVVNLVAGYGRDCLEPVGEFVRQIRDSV